jgi:hypothetical protein
MRQQRQLPFDAMRDAPGNQGGHHVKRVHNHLILRDWLGGLDSNQDSQIQSPAKI